jgi:hypothetical protein
VRPVLAWGAIELLRELDGSVTVAVESVEVEDLVPFLRLCSEAFADVADLVERRAG